LPLSRVRDASAVRGHALLRVILVSMHVCYVRWAKNFETVRRIKSGWSMSGIARSMLCRALLRWSQ